MLCHPERSGGICITVAIPNLQGHQIVDSLHFFIPNAVVGSIIRLLLQACKANTQPDLSWRRDDKVYESFAFNPERSGGIYSTVAIPSLQGHQIVDSLHFVIPNARWDL